MKDSDWGQVKVVERQSSYFLRWLLIIIRSLFVIICFLINICVRKTICPFIPFQQVKRYIESIVNLLSMRVVLILLGFISFQCESFAFFRRESVKFYLKSGFIGIGTHKSILDYFYYSYLLNPVFVRIIIYKKGDTEQIYYAPLSFIEGLQCALDCRGFDPIIIHNDRQYKALKYRKLAMKTLVSECFQQQLGPIFILLPGLIPNIHISINKNVAQDIYENEVKFERSLIGFSVQPEQRVAKSIYKNQLYVMIDLLAHLSWLTLKIQAIDYRKDKHRYDKITYASYVDKFYKEKEYAVKQIDYEYYLLEMDRLFMTHQQRKHQ